MDIAIDTGKYREFCDHEPSVPLFSQAWWLDAVAGRENWNAVLVYRENEVVGALPYVIKRVLGNTLLAQPKLTQSLGPWVRPSQAKYAKALAWEKDILGALADGLPPFGRYRQSWDAVRANWLPFYWRGFEQTTRYSYVLNDISDLESLWQGFQKDIRGNIRKATSRFGVYVRTAEDISELLPVLRKTFDRQGRRLPFSENFLYRLDRAVTEQGKRAILLGEDGKGQLHAGTYIAWEGNTAYQLLNGYDPVHGQSGAGSLCVWSAIKTASGHVERYDFEGSMLEPVERFFRAFGARQVPYFHVTKTPSRILRVADCLRKIANGPF